MNRGKLDEPIGFWRFVIIGTIVMTILRAIVFQTPLTGPTLFPFAAMLYVLYRILRLQPSWPFRRPDSGQAQQVIVPNSEVESPGKKLRNPVTADLLKTLSKKMKSSAVAHPMDPKKYVEPLMADGHVRMSPKQYNDSLISSVGLRSKTVRKKTVRTKTVRQPRP